MNNTLYKALTADGKSPYQGHPWPLPERNGDGWTPGEWVDAGDGELVECGHGIHVCTLEQLPGWFDETLYIFEPAPGTDRLDGDDKTVVRRGRLLRRVETWSDTTARLFVADCAERLLPLYEARHPDDDRPRKAIQAARDYAHGRIDEDELRATWRAAGAAARAARAAAWDAACVAWAAAWAAAWDAFRATAHAAARTIAWDAEREWTSQRLGLYLDRGEEASEVPVEAVSDEEETDE